MTATNPVATDHVILVDEQNNEIGLAEKLSAHQLNQLHRAFSIFIFRYHPTSMELELLLQQRSLHKYHSALLWTNTCCSHPRAGETVIEAGQRRLHEELGFSAKLKEIGWFHYNVHLINGLYENEIDHVLIGMISSTQKIIKDPQEVHAFRWVSLINLQQELDAHPQEFTPWLKPALELVKQLNGEEMTSCLQQP